MASITLICKQCLNSFVVNYKFRKQKYCSRDCVNAAFSGAGNPAYGKTYRTKDSNPEWCEKISKTSKEREINKGDKNGMKNPEAAKKVSVTRSKKFKNDPSFRKKVSAYVRKAWADGKFNHVAVGKCKWYDHTKFDGTLIKLQETWEVVFAQHLDSLQLEYEAHKGYIRYIDLNGSERSYYPDFYIPMWNSYVDVKGAFFTDLQKHKFDMIKCSNPEINISIITKDEFKDMGIDVSKISQQFLSSVSKKPKS